jgi:hypothetical protein
LENGVPAKLICDGPLLEDSVIESEANVNFQSFLNTLNREIFAAQNVGEFDFFQLAVDKILRTIYALFLIPKYLKHFIESFELSYREQE